MCTNGGVRFPTLEYHDVILWSEVCKYRLACTPLRLPTMPLCSGWFDLGV